MADSDERKRLMDELYRRQQIEQLEGELQRRGVDPNMNAAVNRAAGANAQSAGGFALKTAAETVGNVPRSAAKYAGDIYKTLSDPRGAVTNAYTLGRGILQHLNLVSGTDAEKYAEQVGNSVLQRYGSVEAALNTLKNDPVGFSADISTVLTPLAGMGRGAVGTAARVTNPATLPLKTAGKAVAPLTIPEARQGAVGTLREAGVDITAGQATGRRGLQKAEKELGGTTSEDFSAAQKEQFTRAALQTAGEDAGLATTEVINRAHDRIGGVMDDLERKYAPKFDNQLLIDLQTAQTTYNDITNEHYRVPAVEKAYNAAISLITDPKGMTGEKYAKLRSDMGKSARSLAQDAKAETAVYAIQHALDNAAERSIPQGSPDLNLWKEARRQYRNLLSIEKATNYAGDAAGGVITPQNLRRSLQATQGQDNYARGRGDMQGLARAGEQILPSPADSNTASRSRIIHTAQALGVGLGGLATGTMGMSPAEMIAAMTFGYGVPRAIGEGLVRGRRYLVPNPGSLRDIVGRGIPQLGGPSSLLLEQAGRLPAQ